MSLWESPVIMRKTDKAIKICIVIYCLAYHSNSSITLTLDVPILVSNMNTTLWSLLSLVITIS